MPTSLKPKSRPGHRPNVIPESKSKRKHTSTKKIKANQANAKKSTGPITDYGKANSSQNAIRHGLLSAAIKPIPELGETAEQINRLQAAINESFSPNTAIEEILLEQLVSLTWRLRRTQHLESNAFEKLFRDSVTKTNEMIDENQLQLILRYQSTLGRQFHQTLNQLRRMKIESRLQQEKESLLEQRATDKRIRDFIFADPPFSNLTPHLPTLEIDNSPEETDQHPTGSPSSPLPAGSVNKKLRNEPKQAYHTPNPLPKNHLAKTQLKIQAASRSARKAITPGNTTAPRTAAGFLAKPASRITAKLISGGSTTSKFI